MKRLVLVLIALALALPASAGAQPNGITYPELTGPYDVGRTSRYAVDRTRAETYTADPNDVRELMLYLWYPVERGAATPSAPWLEGDLAAAVAGLFGVNPAAFAAIRVHAVTDAPLAGAQPAYPVLIFSPGDVLSHPVFFSAFAEQLASHGYIVVGIAHTYTAFVSAFPDGRVIPQLRAANPSNPVLGDEPPYDKLQHTWEKAQAVLAVTSADALFVVDCLSALNASDPLLAGKLGLERVGIFGHTLGGATAVEAAARDPRIKAAAALEGNLWNMLYLGIPAPLLFVSDERSAVNQPFAWPWEQTAEEMGLTDEQVALALSELNAAYTAYVNAPTAYSVSIAGTSYANFSDMALLAPLFAPAFPDAANFLGTIEPVRALDITTDYLVTFFHTYLQVPPSDLLAGPSPYPEVTYDFHVR